MNYHSSILVKTTYTTFCEKKCWNHVFKYICTSADCFIHNIPVSNSRHYLIHILIQCCDVHNECWKYWNLNVKESTMVIIVNFDAKASMKILHCVHMHKYKHDRNKVNQSNWTYTIRLPVLIPFTTIMYGATLMLPISIRLSYSKNADQCCHRAHTKLY